MSADLPPDKECLCTFCNHVVWRWNTKLVTEEMDKEIQGHECETPNYTAQMEAAALVDHPWTCPKCDVTAQDGPLIGMIGDLDEDEDGPREPWQADSDSWKGGVE